VTLHDRNKGTASQAAAILRELVVVTPVMTSGVNFDVAQIATRYCKLVLLPFCAS
jgi:hypothetical protein